MAKMQVLLENYVTLLQVGIHDHERRAPQRVSVSVAAELRQLPNGEDISGTYDYTQIVDIIQQMAHTHHDLLESFARMLGDHLLQSAQLSHVEIKLLKLDVLSDGSLGVRYSAP